MKQWRIAVVVLAAALVAYLAGSVTPRAWSQSDRAPAEASSGYVSPDIDAETAMRVLEAARAKAEEMDLAMDIAVVDAGANLKSFLRMDNAWLGSIDIAIRKAKTSRYFDMNTGEIGKLSQPGGSLYNIEVSNGGLITFPGGIPLHNADGKIIGAIGVSGSSVENDHEVAMAGAGVLAGH